MATEYGTLNTSTTPLGSGATFTGEWETNEYASVMVSCQADNTGTLYFDFSNDAGVNFSTFPVSGFALASGIHEFHTALKGPRSFRVRLVNDTGAQSYLRLYTYYDEFPKAPNAPLNQSLNDDSDATIVKSIGADQLTAEGRWSDRFFVHKFGRNSDQDSGDLPADIWDGGGGGGAYTGFPVSDSETVELLSSSASDSNTVFIEGLDADWEVQSETVTLNGTTPVASPYQEHTAEFIEATTHHHRISSAI